MMNKHTQTAARAYVQLLREPPALRVDDPSGCGSVVDVVDDDVCVGVFVEVRSVGD